MNILRLLVSSTAHNLDDCVLTLQHTTKHASQNLNEKLELERSYYMTSFWRMMSFTTYDLDCQISESMKWLLYMSPRWWDAIHYMHPIPLVISANWRWANKKGKAHFIGLKRQTGQVDWQVQGSYTVYYVFSIIYYPNLRSAIKSFC